MTPPPLVSKAVVLARGFLAWWLRELRAAVPERWRSKGAVRSDIILHRDRVEIVQTRGDEGVRYVEETGLAELTDESWEQLRTLVADTRARVLLTPPDTFTTVVPLPLAARSRLRASVALQLDGIIPVRPELATWSFRLLRRLGNRLDVLVAVALTQHVAALVQQFREHDVPSPPIWVEAHGVSAELVPGHRGSLTRERRLDRNAALFGLALLASVPLTTFAAANVLTFIANNKAEALEPIVRPILAENRLAERDALVRTTLRPLLRHPTATDILETLAVKLAPPAFVHSVEIRNDRSGTIELDAIDGDAATAALDSMPMLADARLDGEEPSSATAMRTRFVFRIR